MSAEGDPRFVELAEADRTLLTILDALSKHVLQADALLRGNLNGSWGITIVGFAAAFQLLKIVGRQQAGVEGQLAHPSEQTKHIRLHLMIVRMS